MHQRRKTVTSRMRKRVEVRFGTDKPTFPGFSGNISRCGVMIRTTRVFCPGTILKLELKRPQGSIHMSGKVEWARAGGIQFLPTGRVGMGVKLIEPSEEFLAWVRDNLAPKSKVGLSQ